MLPLSTPVRPSCPASNTTGLDLKLFPERFQKKKKKKDKYKEKKKKKLTESLVDELI